MFNFKDLLDPKNYKTFVIAEVGQNHQGELAKAKRLIEVAKECGADCVKFQKSCLKEKFNKKALERPYTSPNSFGATYGEHKAFLEFSESEFVQLQLFASNIGILFTASAMDSASLQFLASVNVPFIKIGSGDANNYLLIEKAAKTNIPLIISTGMQSLQTVRNVYSIVSEHHKNFAFLHCVSAYPAPYEDLNLQVINLFKTEFPDIPIGYSGHELGNHITVAAVAMGCKIIERHITLDKRQKGSDHICSLDPNEFTDMVNGIRSLEIALGQPLKVMRSSELSCYEKLGKTLVYVNNLPRGHLLRSNDVDVKVAERKGVNGSEINNIVGMTLKIDVGEDESVLLEHLC